MKLLSALLLALSPLTALAHGDLHERIAALTARLQAEPQVAVLHFQRGELERQHGDLASAIDDLRTAAKLDPKLEGVDLALGRALFATHDWLAACLALNRELDRHPRHVTALLLRARCLDEAGDKHGAVADFDRGIELSPDPQPDDYLDRAYALVALGRTDDALVGLDEGLTKLGPAVSLVLRAIDLEAAKGCIDAALDRVNRAMDTSARREIWLEKRANLLRQAGRNAEAEAAAREALAALNHLPASRRSTTNSAELECRLRAMLVATP